MNAPDEELVVTGSSLPRTPPVAPPVAGPTLVRIALVMLLAFGVLAAGAGYWQVVDADRLARAPDNPGVIAAGRLVVRGQILDRDGRVLAASKRDAKGEPYRTYADPAVSPVVGYAARLFGTAGLERAYNAELSGSAGRDPLADLVRRLRGGPSNTADLETTISLPLQRLAVRLLGGRRGAVVLLDPRNGEVLVLASTPVYDASAVANPATSRSVFSALQADDSLPLLNRATQGRYVPGSVMKIVTAIAALGSGAIRANTSFAEQPASEEDGLRVSGFRIRDAHHLTTGARALTLPEAVEVSCNIYFALAGLRTGGAAFTSWADRLGFGAPIPFDLPTASSQVTGGGGNFGGGFSDDVELAAASFGQGETLVTPLQMALVAATVANDGALMRPRLVRRLTWKDGLVREIDPIELRRVLAPEPARQIAEAMRRAVEGDAGREFTEGAKVPGVPTAGKSGTAELGGSGEPHSWFIGFAPANRPEVAIAVIVEQGGRGAERAAPLAGRMLRAYFESLVQ